VQAMLGPSNTRIWQQDQGQHQQYPQSIIQMPPPPPPPPLAAAARVSSGSTSNESDSQNSSSQQRSGDATSTSASTSSGPYPLTNIEHPGVHDCMFGRGGGTSNHIG
jgi:hypothetical protein